MKQVKGTLAIHWFHFIVANPNIYLRNESIIIAQYVCKAAYGKKYIKKLDVIQVLYATVGTYEYSLLRQQEIPVDPRTKFQKESENQLDISNLIL